MEKTSKEEDALYKVTIDLRQLNSITVSMIGQDLVRIKEKPTDERFRVLLAITLLILSNKMSGKEEQDIGTLKAEAEKSIRNSYFNTSQN